MRNDFSQSCAEPESLGYHLQNLYVSFLERKFGIEQNRKPAWVDPNRDL